jgi:hypothetical protein
VKKEIVNVEILVEKLVHEDELLTTIDEMQAYTNFKLNKISNNINKKNFRLKL